ncbi:MAG TPA: hypothetical protein VMU99_06730 [Acidimicrobiales bacterium]|nr:hypothetical protein [Acidimicrobiales bacterium]
MADLREKKVHGESDLSKDGGGALSTDWSAIAHPARKPERS